MNRSNRLIEDARLLFFGKIAASVNHDIRNIFATIYENAGLLMDYSSLASKKKPIDPEKVSLLAGRITDQVRRGDRLLKGMGKFSHSVDDNLKTVDLDEILQILIALSERFASMHKVKIRVNKVDTPIEICTSPFLLLYVLFMCLEFAIKAAGKDSRIEITSQKNELSKSVRFGPLPRLAQMPTESIPSVRIPDFLPMLNTTFITDNDGQNVIVVFSKRDESD